MPNNHTCTHTTQYFSVKFLAEAVFITLVCYAASSLEFDIKLRWSNLDVWNI